MRNIFCTIYVFFTISALNVYAENYLLCDITITQRLPNYSSPVKTQKGFDISKDYYINENNKYYSSMIFDNKIEIREGEHQGTSVWANNYVIDRFTGAIEGSMSYSPNFRNFNLNNNENKHYTITGTCKPVQNTRF